MVYIGECLKQYRQRKGVKREEFASSIGVTANYLDKLESSSPRTRKAVNAELMIHACETYQDYSLYHDWKRELDKSIKTLKGRAKKIS